MKTLDGIEMSPSKFDEYWYIDDNNHVVSVFGRLEGDRIIWWDDMGKDWIRADAMYSKRKNALLAALATEK